MFLLRWREVSIVISKLKKFYFEFTMLLLILSLHTASIWVDGFSDWYFNQLFPYLSGGMRKLSNLFSFSIGEWMLLMAVLFSILLVIFGLCSFFIKSVKKYAKVLTIVWLNMFFIAMLIMELNCFVLYQTTPLKANNHLNTKEVQKSEYGFAELTILRNYLVDQVNEYSKKSKRDVQGDIWHTGNIREQAIDSMQQLGSKYPQLQGTYGKAKPLFFSDFFSQQYILGYYFPFSMEANYNSNIYITNLPVTICHELAHTKGFLREDEANFLAYLACMESKEELFQYSGYLSVLNYVDSDFYKELGNNKKEYLKFPQILEQVRSDDIFIQADIWERIEKEAILPTDLLQSASNTFTDTTLRLNGVQEGVQSYSYVVKLLLQYYDGILY